MNIDEFKEKYTKDSFFWINSEEQSNKIQSILLQFGLKNPIGGSEKIIWHEGFKNLCTFGKDKFRNFDYFQKTNMWLPNARYGNPVNYDVFIKEFELLNIELCQTQP